MDEGQGGDEESQRFGNAGDCLLGRGREIWVATYHDRGTREQLLYKLNTTYSCLLLVSSVPIGLSQEWLRQNAHTGV